MYSDYPSCNRTLILFIGRYCSADRAVATKVRHDTCLEACVIFRAVEATDRGTESRRAMLRGRRILLK